MHLTTSAKAPSRRPTNGIQTHHSRADRKAMGKALRDKCPRAAHASWKPPHDRPDPVDLVVKGDKGRIPPLVPLRHGRMVASPFTFYRGSALAMAVDLAGMPTTDIRVQCGGDCHVVNFRGLATPERQVIFAINDLDETLPAPWEWDLKRLTASLVIACRDNDLHDSFATEAVYECVRSYRESMAELAEMPVMDLWYEAIEMETLIGRIKDPDLRHRAIKRLAKGHASGTSEGIFPKLTEAYGGSRMFRDTPPTVFHWKHHVAGAIHAEVRDAFERYRRTLIPAHRFLLDRYEVKDAAIKVVGVGSVGTSCWVLLLMADEGDVLILQVKEARASVLEPYAGKSAFPNHGQRVVAGLQLMQPASDIFLGWTEGRLGRHFYIRQLRDVKIKFAVETFGTPEMSVFASWCGQSLALSHARSGDAAMIAGYVGKSDVLDEALGAFSIAYADQNEKDHAAFKRAVDDGKLEANYDRDT